MLNIDKYKVSEDNLKFKCSLDDLDFKTTEDIEPLGGIIGQDRAVTSIEFGLKMKHKGYNIYIAGVSGIGRTNYAKSLIKKNIKFNPIFNQTVTTATDINANLESVNHPICVPNT